MIAVTYCCHSSTNLNHIQPKDLLFTLGALGPWSSRSHTCGYKWQLEPSKTNHWRLGDWVLTALGPCNGQQSLGHWQQPFIGCTKTKDVPGKPKPPAPPTPPTSPTELYLQKPMWDFPAGPVAKTPCFQCRGPGSIPGQGTRSLPSVTTRSLHAAAKDQRSCLLQLRLVRAK